MSPLCDSGPVLSSSLRAVPLTLLVLVVMALRLIASVIIFYDNHIHCFVLRSITAVKGSDCCKGLKRLRASRLRTENTQCGTVLLHCTTCGFQVSSGLHNPHHQANSIRKQDTFVLQNTSPGFLVVGRFPNPLCWSVFCLVLMCRSLWPCPLICPH